MCHPPRARAAATPCRSGQQRPDSLPAALLLTTTERPALLPQPQPSTTLRTSHRPALHSHVRTAPTLPPSLGPLMNQPASSYLTYVRPSSSDPRMLLPRPPRPLMHLRVLSHLRVHSRKQTPPPPSTSSLDCTSPHLCRVPLTWHALAALLLPSLHLHHALPPPLASACCLSPSLNEASNPSMTGPPHLACACCLASTHLAMVREARLMASVM